MIVSLTSAYVDDDPAWRRRWCWSGPAVSFRELATLTWSGSCVALSRSYRASLQSHVENDSSKLLCLNIGFKSVVRKPMLHFPQGVEKRWQSCLWTSRPIAVWCCLRTVAPAKNVVVMIMYLKLLASCIHCSASSGVPAAAVSSVSVSAVVALSALASILG